MAEANAEKLITGFYTAFQNLDHKTMNSFYSDDIVFFDPAFDLLKGSQARAMWQMLCSNAQDFKLSFGNISNRGDGYYTCDWQADYLFSQTGRPVHNVIKAYMKIENGKIVEHSDAFSLHKWSAQALGLPGKLLGWNRWFQQKIKNNARKKLLSYMHANGLA